MKLPQRDFGILSTALLIALTVMLTAPAESSWANHSIQSVLTLVIAQPD